VPLPEHGGPEIMIRGPLRDEDEDVEEEEDDRAVEVVACWVEGELTEPPLAFSGWLDRSR